MFYRQNISQQIVTRFQRVANAPFSAYEHQLGQLLTFINRTPYFAAIIHQLEVAYPDWRWNVPAEQKWFSGDGFLTGGEEDEHALVSYGLIREAIASPQYDIPMQVGYEICRENSGEICKGAFTSTYVAPLVDYLLERIAEGNNVLFLLEKYKHKIEWFRRAELLNRVSERSRASEQAVDDSLREYLFDQGIEYPFSQPLSESGRADIVADVGEVKPLVLEIKLFDPDRGYARPYIAKGFRQALSYADDYGQNAGYLVIFNCTPKRIIFQTDALDNLWPPRLQVGHTTILLIVIDLYVWEHSASQRSDIEQYVITSEQLLPSPDELMEGAV